jgi:hypothetical protein
MHLVGNYAGAQAAFASWKYNDGNERAGAAAGGRGRALRERPVIAALAFVRCIPSMLSPKGWLAVALSAAFLLFGRYGAHRAAEGERDRKAAEAPRTSAERLHHHQRP